MKHYKIIELLNSLVRRVQSLLGQAVTVIIKIDVYKKKDKPVVGRIGNFTDL